PFRRAMSHPQNGRLRSSGSSGTNHRWPICLCGGGLPGAEHMPLSTDERRALRLLANTPHGRTLANMLAHGFKRALLNELVSPGLAITQCGTSRAGGRQIEFAWLTITEAGRAIIDMV